MKSYLKKDILLFCTRLFIALGLFIISRILFLIFNAQYFWHYPFLSLLKTFFYGLQFDLSALIYINIGFILFSIINFFAQQKFIDFIGKILYVLGNSIGFFLNIADAQYFPFSRGRISAGIFSQWNDIKNLSGQYIISYWYIFFITLLVIIALWKVYSSYKTYLHKWNIKWLSIKISSIAILAACFVVLARGGFQLMPVAPIDAAKYVEADLVPLTLNTPFNIFRSFQKGSEPSFTFTTDTEAEQIVSPIHQYHHTSNPKNIFIIILESFSKEYVGFFNNGKGYTPFLDSLCKHSFTFRHSYASGKRSTDGIVAILSSIPQMSDNTFITGLYQSNKVQSLGACLQQLGYETAFFHGAKNGSMGFEDFVYASNTGKYFGFNEYPNKPDFDEGGWGVFDEPFLQYVCDKTTATKQPFFHAVFTLSSHYPFHIPKQYQNKFPKGTNPSSESIGYADFALRKFFESASKTSWFKNTLFIISADHTALNATPRYTTSLGEFEIPILFYTADTSFYIDTTKSIQQIDIMPTVLDYVGYTKPFFSLGKSILNDTNIGKFSYFNNLYQWNSFPWMLIHNGTKPISLYNIQKDTLMKENIIDKEKTITTYLSKQLEAFLQVYSHRMKQNNVYVE